MVYVMIVSILAAGVWGHIKLVAANARSAYEAAREQAIAEIQRQAEEPITKAFAADRHDAMEAAIPTMVAL